MDKYLKPLLFTFSSTIIMILLCMLVSFRVEPILNFLISSTSSSTVTRVFIIIQEISFYVFVFRFNKSKKEEPFNQWSSYTFEYVFDPLLISMGALIISVIIVLCNIF